ncbi:MAG: DEAD/DEAH box helicase, partial [Flavobacteriales bacterium]|nr:DEAD/DEAH box helicase [Flavobacteriales bacterium]
MYKTRNFNKKRGNFNRRRSNAPKKSTGFDLSKYVNSEVKKTPVVKYEPTYMFTDFMLDQELVNRIEQKGFKAPAEIQDKAIPKILDGKDLIGIAGTGTGKTAAFLIPIIQEMIEQKRDRYSLIIAPTRELANQINDEFRSLTKGLGIFSTCLIGGSSV